MQLIKNITFKIFNFIIHKILIYRIFYHELILSLLVFNKNNSNNNCLILGNSEKNLENNIALMAIARKYLKQNWEIKFIYKGNVFFKFFVKKDKIANALIINERQSGKIYKNKGLFNEYEWKIDLENKTAYCKNINFFDIIDSSICNFNKVYHYDQIDQSYKDKFIKMVKSIDPILDLCVQIKNQSKLQNIVIVLLDADRFPNAIIVEYLKNNNLLNKIKIFSLGKSYSIYNDKGNWHPKYFMLTKTNTNYAHHYYAWKKDFNFWVKNTSISTQEIENFFKKIYYTNHYIESKNNTKKENILIKINNKKNSNKKYFVYMRIYFTIDL